MIPKQTLENYPIFGDNATKVQPDNAKMAAGFQQADVLPAEWMNWAWAKNSKGITDLNMGIASIETEIVNLLTAAGITPAEATENQVLSAVQYLINNKTGELSSLTTTAKTTLVAACNEILSALGAHTAKTDNPHSVTKAQVGLSNVTNVTTESTPTENSVNNITSGAVYAHTSRTDNPHGVTKKQVGLENVTNVATESTPTNGSTKNITSGAVYSHTSNKQNPHGVTAAQVGLGNVANKGTDTAVTQNSTNNVTSGAVFSAIAATISSGNNANGNWVKLKNNLIIQWGAKQQASGTAISFPTSFTNKPVVVCTREGSQSQQGLNITSVSTTGFTPQVYGGGGSWTYNWIAIGY